MDTSGRRIKCAVINYEHSKGKFQGGLADLYLLAGHHGSIYGLGTG